MLHHLIEVWFQWVHDWGYLGVIILMAMESSIFPVPSELVVPPAAILAAHGSAHGGDMTLFGVVLAGTFGSWLGSAITYWVSRLVGRPLIARYGHLVFMPPKKVARAERFMHRYESGGIFFARLLPVLRHLISIPAGIIRMNFLKFSVLTTVGAAIWCTVLAWMGGRVGASMSPAEIATLKAGTGVDLMGLIRAVKHESLWVIGVIVLVCVLYFVAMRMTEHHDESQPGSK
jgi:membrane protein DedA with SNARE-associated domain